MSARTSREDRLIPRPDKRARILSAAERLLAERGADAVTVDAVAEAAGVAPSAFSATFADRTDLLLTVFDDATDRAGAAMIAAYQVEERWIDGVRAALLELLRFFDERPRLARFMLVESAAAEPPLSSRRERALSELARALDAARPVAAAELSLAPFGAEAVVGTVAAILHGRLQEDPVPSLSELCGSLMGVIALPYLGVAAARGELSRSDGENQESAPRVPRAAADAAGRRGLRATLRTLEALGAIAQSPGLSNRKVAAAVGISDEGQASRLLARLRRVGLIDSDEPPPGGRGSKSWRLTPAGREMLDEIGLTASSFDPGAADRE